MPIIPKDARRLQDEHNIAVRVQPSPNRVFPDQAYREEGITVQEDLSACPVVFGVKEIPPDFFEPGHTYVFFAHVIKGQPYNMPMLVRLLDQGCQLIGYEMVTDERGRRLIFFGHHAGLAGMIDTLWALGRRLNSEGIANPFADLRQTHEYGDLEEAKAALSTLGKHVAQEGLPEAITPLICGFAGYGNVFRGANEIFELLPVEEIEPPQVADVAQHSDARDVMYKVVFREEDTVEPISPQDEFELQDYYDHPAKYRSRFKRYLSHLTLLVNCVYWDKRYPRLVTKADLRELYVPSEQPRLRVIGDISCDIEGAIQATTRCTDPGDPVYVYDPFADRAVDGVGGRGPVILAVDILPSELPREASTYFSSVLMDYVPVIVSTDYSVPFNELELPPEIRRALIVHQGELTPAYRYLEAHLP